VDPWKAAWIRAFARMTKPARKKIAVRILQRLLSSSCPTESLNAHCDEKLSPLREARIRGR